MSIYNIADIIESRITLKRLGLFLVSMFFVLAAGMSWKAGREALASHVFKLTEVGTVPFGLFDRSHIISSQNLPPNFLVLSLLYFLSTFTLGFTFWRIVIDGGNIKEFFRIGFFSSPRTSHRLATFSASFTIGYFLQIAINRLLTIYLPQDLAVDVGLSLSLGWLLVFLSITLITAKRPKELRELGRFFLSIVMLLFGLLTLIVFQVQIDDSYVTGDSTLRFISRLPEMAQLSRFPFLDQHYDEPIYLYPLLMKAIRGGEGYSKLFPYLLLHSIGKFSAFALTYLFVRKLSKKFYLALAITFFLFMGSHSFVPWFCGRWLFDSLNPPLRAMHNSRVLSMILPLFFWWLTDFFLSRKRSQVNSKGEAASLTLLGIGISSLSIHIGFSFFVMAGIAFLGKIFSNLKKRTEMSLLTCTFLPLTAIGFVYLTHAYSAFGGLLLMFSFLIAAIVGLLPLFRNTGECKSILGRLNKRQVGFMSLGLLMGYLGAGQVFRGHLFEAPLKIVGIKVSDFIITDFLPTKPLPFHFSTVNEAFWQFDQFEFLLAFALPFFFLGSAALFFRKFHRDFDLDNSPNLVSIHCLLIAFSTMFGLAFFVLNFIATVPYDHTAIWVRTRLIEPWFYSVLLLTLIVCADQLGKTKIRLLFVTMVISVWGVAPYVLGIVEDRGLMGQLEINAMSLVNAILK